MTPGTLLVLAIIALIMGYTIRTSWKNRGKGSCASCHNAKHGCTHCSGDGNEVDPFEIDQEKLAEIKAKHEARQ